jgi:hypothetical protein
MSKMKVLVDWALKNSGDAVRYHRRMAANPTLVKLGCLPQELTEISNHESPWLCHGLAFRMATFSDDNDYIFERLETLLKLAENASGWRNEYANWNNPANHWAKKWDKFHHFLWLLQCHEFFSQRGLKVSFPASRNQAKPDLLIAGNGQAELYAECYFYSKWWPREFYFEHLLRKIDKNLAIKRTYNVAYEPSSNPFSSDAQLTIALEQLAGALIPERLEQLRAAAQLVQPQTVCEIGDIRILLEGEGEYQPSTNAHGDPECSLPVYLREIINDKKDSNGLNVSRPNLVLVNALGLDFQFSLPESSVQIAAITKPPCSLDEIWISACGIDGKLETCQQDERILKILRVGYSGSGF